MVTTNGTKIRIDANGFCGKGRISVCAAKDVFRTELCITERNGGKEFSFLFSGKGKELKGEFFLDNAREWSLTSPELYDFLLRIEYADGEEIAKGAFGFRRLSTDGKYVYLNGDPIFVKGYIRGAAAHEHGNDAGLPEKDFYRKNILQAKKFGFNLVRFHSVIPDALFLEAADELGILVHMELRLPNDIYDNLSEMTSAGEVGIENDDIERIIAENYEHPSLAVYCIGNEIKGADKERIEEICHLIKRLDPSRLFTDTCAWGKNGRPYIDIDIQHMGYYFPFGRHSEMFADTDTLTVACEDKDVPISSEGENCFIRRDVSFDVPLLAHEVCHYTALRDFRVLREKFRKSQTPEPWWIGEELKMIDAKGMSEIYPRMYAASKFFQFECWKTAFEAIRRSRILGGFHFLQFADTDRYENSNGVVDCFDDENYTKSEDFLKFNGNKILLADLGNRQFYGGEQVVFPIDFSNFGNDGIKRADLVFTLAEDGGEICARGNLPNVDIGKKGIYEICKITLILPDSDGGKCLRLLLKLVADGRTCSENDWKIWVYKKKPPVTYREFVAFEKDDAMITDSPEKAFDALADGKRVCLVYRSEWTRHVRYKNAKKPVYAFRATWNRFKPVIWDRGTNYGGLCDEELLNRYGFPAGKYYDFNYSLITEDCDKIILDDFPVKVRSIITGIDKNVRDRFDAGKDFFNLRELMYDRTLRNFSYLFEVGVGRGKLLVCGLNLTGLDTGEPSAVALADFIREYIGGKDFAPADSITLPQLKAYMKQCAEKPVKERMMTQYWELDDAPVESKQYWKESREYLSEEEQK